MMNIWNEFDDMFNMMNAFVNRRQQADSTIGSCGLKSIIKRPHNLLTLKSKEGATTGYRLEVVTTPFKKEDVKVSVLNSILTVQCGADNFKDEDGEFMIYHGISSQSYEFSIKLTDDIDVSNIDASVNDGILKINLPLKQIEDKKATPLQIEVK